jgi:hypothetical protein
MIHASTSKRERGRDNLQRARSAFVAKRRRIVFGSVRAAVGWYVETSLRMREAHGLHPRTEKIDDFGTRVPVDVDGGQGGDLDELLATLATMSKAFDRLEEYNPTFHRVALSYGGGESQAEIGKAIGQSPRIVSDYLARGEAFLAALIGGPDGVLRRG